MKDQSYGKITGICCSNCKYRAVAIGHRGDNSNYCLLLFDKNDREINLPETRDELYSFIRAIMRENNISSNGSCEYFRSKD